MSHFAPCSAFAFILQLLWAHLLCCSVLSAVNVLCQRAVCLHICLCCADTCRICMLQCFLNSSPISFCHWSLLYTNFKAIVPDHSHGVCTFTTFLTNPCLYCCICVVLACHAAVWVALAFRVAVKKTTSSQMLLLTQQHLLMRLSRQQHHVCKPTSD